MGSRDRYTIDLTCPECKATGWASMSEWDVPTAYSGNGREVEKMSEGFRPVEGDRGQFEFFCLACGVKAKG